MSQELENLINVQNKYTHAKIDTVEAQLDGIKIMLEIILLELKKEEKPCK